MTERINTTDVTATSTAWTPTSDFSVQAQIDPKSKGYLVVEGHADDSAPWLPLGIISALTTPPMLRFSAIPSVRLSVVNNQGGYTLLAWSGE